jgi:hypothetical protein
MPVLIEECAWSKRNPCSKVKKEVDAAREIGKAPNAKLQAPEKSQTPKPKQAWKPVPPSLFVLAASHLLRGSFWCLGFGAFLELGASGQS